MRVSAAKAPVCGVLFLDGGYNELFHSLVRLGHQVNRRALLHDVDLFLERFTDHLAHRWQTQSGGALDLLTVSAALISLACCLCCANIFLANNDSDHICGITAKTLYISLLLWILELFFYSLMLLSASKTAYQSGLDFMCS